MPPKDSVLGKHLKSCNEKIKNGINKEALNSGRFKSERGQKWTLPNFDPISVPNHGKPNKFYDLKRMRREEKNRRNRERMVKKRKDEKDRKNNK